MRHTFTLLIILLYSYWCRAQTRNPALDVNRTNIWRFGDASLPGASDVPGLDFSNGTPVVINAGSNPVFDGATTISDGNGNLQLYGGDQSIFDRNNSLLSNAGVVGDSGWIGISPCNIAIPMPNSPNLIYYFSAQVSLKYTVVDMNFNNGKGEAILRNVELEPIPVESKLAAVHHCNGNDVWIVGHRWLTNTFYAYLLTDTGINPTPVLSNVGPVANEQGFWQAGCIKFSPNGNKIVIAFGGFNEPPYLFDFDKSTGVINNPIPLQKDIGENGLSFSPDNSKLYISTINGLVLQYNLNATNAADIANSRREILNVFTSFVSIQMGLDGKIYIIPAGNPHRKFLTVINHPNNLDTLCHPQLDAIYLNGGYGNGGTLLNTLESFFYTGSSAYPCYGDTTTSGSNIDNEDAIALKVYPNPFTDYSFIEVTGPNARGKLEYQLCDIAGKVLPTHITETDWWDGKRLIFHRARLPTGIYMLTVKTLHQTQTIKLSVL